MKNSIVRYRGPLGNVQILGSGPPENYVLTESDAKATADKLYNERNLPASAITFPSEQAAIDYVRKNPRMWLAC